MMTLLALIAFWLSGYGVFKLLYGKSLPSEYVILSYPVGMALVGLLAFVWWMSGLPFGVFAPIWWLASAVSGVVWVTFERNSLFQTVKKVKSIQWRNLLETKSSFAEWPWLYMLAVLALSVGVAGVWQAFLHPISWDTVALYDFRAWRIAEGWQAVDFMQQFTRMPQYQAYDFLHPITSSIWWALLYRSGAEQVLFVYAALLITVFLLGWRIWQSWSARMVWPFFWLGMPALFVSLTEGYGAYPATLFWVLGLLWWTLQVRVKQELSQRDWVVVGLLLLGSVSGRVTEYYWVVFTALVAIFLVLQKYSWLKKIRNFFSFAVLPVTSIILWFTLRGQAVAVSGSVDADRSLSALITGILQGDWWHIPVVVLQELGHILSSPVTPWLVLAILGSGLYWYSKRRVTEYQWIWLGSLLGCLAMLLVGMVVLHVVFGARWEEARLAMDRAIMPILGVLFVMLTELTEEFASKI